MIVSARGEKGKAKEDATQMKGSYTFSRSLFLGTGLSNNHNEGCLHDNCDNCFVTPCHS